VRDESGLENIQDQQIVVALVRLADELFADERQHVLDRTLQKVSG